MNALEHPVISHNNPLATTAALRGPRGYSAEVTVEAVARMLRLLRAIAPFMPLLAIPIAAVFWTAIPRLWLVLWLIGALAVPLGQYLLAHRFLSRPSDLDRAVKFGRLTTVTSVCSGLGWGMAGLMLPYAQTIGQQLLILGLVIGIPSGSIFGCSFWPATQYANSIPGVGLTVVGLFLQGTPGTIGMAVALLIYLPIIWVQTEQAHRTEIDSIRLRFENLDLVKRLEVEKSIAESANAAKSKFLAAASHDLRQPLHSLGLFLTTLTSRLGRPDLQPLLGNINSSVTALHGLLNALLDISKLDAGAVETEIRDVNLVALLARLTNEYQLQAQSKGLQWRLSSHAFAVRSDAVLLETILRNLISNALRYTERGEVEIRSVIQGEFVHISIRDSGVGIAPEHQQEIFREFFQLRNPERDRAKGLGLGLAIVERLVRLLDHRLELSSHVGEGTTFTLVLPVGNIDSANIETSTTEKGTESASRILIIDDEASVRAAMSMLLGDWGHDVLEATSLDDALQKIEQPPDVIIADYRLRDEQTGVAAIQAIEARFGAKIPALIVTGDTHPDRIAQAKASGYALLHKPVAPGKLRAFLRSASRIHPV